jgi:hypothetical protein
MSIDFFFALVPYIYIYILSDEINHYARDYLQRKQHRQIWGYIWKLVTINKLMTYFGNLVFSMLFPQTGRRAHAAWKNQQINSWTSHTGIGWFCQINSMLHFNNNNDGNNVA